MKFELTFKTPDVIDQIYQQPIFDFDLESDEYNDSNEELVREQENETKQEILKFLEKFLKYREYITIEFDTEAKTATVIEYK